MRYGAGMATEPRETLARQQRWRASVTAAPGPRLHSGGQAGCVEAVLTVGEA